MFNKVYSFLICIILCANGFVVPPGIVDDVKAQDIVIFLVMKRFNLTNSRPGPTPNPNPEPSPTPPSPGSRM